ncbi:hypothetical protein [Streptomyces colonosanans]|nr:hypothetical protein [Streptomyces colonosanans]
MNLLLLVSGIAALATALLAAALLPDRDRARTRLEENPEMAVAPENVRQ